ncbi:MAG TPA: hypothetical protein VFD66_11105 [Verrucomicrobiae bacterium]|nr:hypothetical protein [Verrucomicrobiae bacterium]
MSEETHQFMDTPQDPREEVRKTFFQHVPEIQSGVVEIKTIAREPGVLSMVVVYAQDPIIDPVGSCVGHRGDRVKAIVKQLSGEFVDIIRWSNSIEHFISNSLGPLGARKVTLDHETGRALVTVDPSAARPSNSNPVRVRLASKVSGWEIFLVEI